MHDAGIMPTSIRNQVTACKLARLRAAEIIRLHVQQLGTAKPCAFAARCPCTDFMGYVNHTLCNTRRENLTLLFGGVITHIKL